MQFISSYQAQSSIPEKSKSEILQLLLDIGECADDLTVNSFYLSYLCARGKIHEVESFIKQLGEHTAEVINMKHMQFYMGTALHVAMGWNSGKLGVDLFDLLWSHGAKYCQDYYGMYPCTQLDQMMWVKPILFGHESFLGFRNKTEFVDMYEHLRETYGLLEYESGMEKYVFDEEDEGYGN